MCHTIMPWRSAVLLAVSLQALCLLHRAATEEDMAMPSQTRIERATVKETPRLSLGFSSAHVLTKRAPGWGKRAGDFPDSYFDDDEEDEDNFPESLSEEKRAPGWGKRAPGWGKRAPGWGKRAPGWGKRAPGWGKRAPGWGKRASTVDESFAINLDKKAPGWGKRRWTTCQEADDEVNFLKNLALEAETSRMVKCGSPK